MNIMVQIELEDSQKWQIKKEIDLLEKRLFLTPSMRFLWMMDVMAKEIWAKMEKEVGPICSSPVKNALKL